MSTRPAAFTAATNVVWSAEFTALATIVLDGNIAWPPTRTVGSAMAVRFISASPLLRGHQQSLFPNRCDRADRIQEKANFLQCLAPPSRRRPQITRARN